MIKKGFDSMASRDRIVSVKGLAEREVKADKVTWPVVTKFGADNLADIASVVKRNNEVVQAFLKDNGVTDKEITISAPVVQDTRTTGYSSGKEPYVYNVTNVVTVTSADVDKVNAIMQKQGELLSQGIAIAGGGWEYTPTYEFTALNSIKPDMIAEATANARKAADRFAADSGSKLGKIGNASQGQFEITDRDQYTPWIKNVRIVTKIDYYLGD